MARRTFFSFRYDADNWRAAIVRNSWVVNDKQNKESAGFFDHAEWESVKKKDEKSIQNWIDGQLKGSSVTVVLIGSDTAGKKWINYEITASHNKGNGILGIYIHKIKNSSGQTSIKGANPLVNFKFTNGGKVITYPVYDWINDNGYENLSSWIEKAAKAAGK